MGKVSQVFVSFKFWLICGLLALASPAWAQPTFDCSFTPSAIGPGSVSTLTFTMTNGSAVPVSMMDFTNTLPAGVTIATPASASTDCLNGMLSAPDGGSTITFMDGSLPAFGTCTVTVNVTSTTPGTHMNVSGDLTSNAGNSGTSSCDLTVATDRPSFSKSFSPSTVQLGQRSTLTFTFDNSLNPATAINFQFTDTLPAGLEIADPANLLTSCGNASITAIPGSNVITLNPFPIPIILAANSTCTISVDVVASGGGLLDNVSSDMTSTPIVGIPIRSSGKATDTLEALVSDSVHITKEFTDDPVPPGGVATLEFRLLNTDRLNSASSIAFTDDLDAALTGMTYISTSSDDCLGSASGSSVLSYSGGSLAAGASCTFVALVQVPAGAAPGIYTNTTNNVSSSLGSGNQASDLLFISDAPVVTKTFTNDPVEAGGTVNLEFTIFNPSSSPASAITFFDDFFEGVPDVVGASIPAPGFCGGATATATPRLNPPPPSSATPARLTISGASLPAGGMCTFSVDLNIAVDVSNGTYPNVTSPITATVNGMTVEGAPASDDLIVVAPPTLQKSILGDPTTPGSTVTFEYTLTLDENAPTNATNISFTDDLNAALAGLAATGTPVAGCGGLLTGTTMLTFSGGSLMPDSNCTFSVSVDVPMGAVDGTYPSPTSAVSATVGGLVTTGNIATDDLTVANLSITKSFTNDPSVAGGTVTVEYTVTNSSTTETFTAITFSDNYAAAVPGMTAIPPPPMTPCGAASVMTLLSGNTFMQFTGGEVLPLSSCTFSIDLNVPAGAATGTYPSPTSTPTATIVSSMSTVILPPAVDNLEVIDPLSIAKSFTDDPVPPGGTVNLQFTLTNSDPNNAINSIAFMDDLDGILSGLAATGLPMAACGGTATWTGTAVDFTGGSLAADTSCVFNVSISVPAGATPGSFVANTTTAITGTVGAAVPIMVTGNMATDNLQIGGLGFSKMFLSETAPTGTTTLRFTIFNPGIGQVTNIQFTDDLNAVLPGLTAVGLPVSPCTLGGTMSGTSLLSFSGGILDPMETCTIDVTVQVPAGAAPGTYLNTTSILSSTAGSVSPASAMLVVNPPPTFAKSFAPNPGVIGIPTTLTFTINNNASNLDATNLDFTDNLPAGLVVATPANAMTSCTGGTITATPGTGTISYSGGTVTAGASCTVTVDVVSGTAGDFPNTSGDLTSSSGNSGPATATLRINPPPLFSKSFSPNPDIIGGTSTLTFTIDNTASTADATGLAFTDVLPAGLVVATPANAMTSCAGGTLTAVAGTGTISYTGGTVTMGATCTISVDVTASMAGSFMNTSGDLTSSLGNSGPASDTLVINAPPLFSKSFSPNPDIIGGVSTLTFTIDNSASTADATGLDFTDVLPAGLAVATPANAMTSCTGGTITAVAGTGTISYTGGTVTAGATCTVSVDVTASMAGSFVNTTGDLISSLGNSGPASDTLVINAPPLFAKSFAPNPVFAGAVSTLTFTIDNSAGTVDATALDFTDNLPAGVTVANPPNAISTCTGGTITAVAGSGVISYTGGTVTAGATCTVSVDVTPATAGAYVNTSGDLTSSLGNSGPATDTLNVNPGKTFSKVFNPDSIFPGTVSTLTFTIDNTGSTVGVTNVAFTDNLPAGVFVAAVPNIVNNCGGTVTALAGSGTIDFSGGAVAAGTTCTISVDVTSIVPGLHTNVTSNLSSSAGNGGTATDDLMVQDAADLVITKVDDIDPVVSGTNLTYTVTVTNNGPSDAQNVVVTDTLPPEVTFVSSTGCAEDPNGVPTCTLGTIAANSSQQYTITVLVDPMASGTITNLASVTSTTPEFAPGDETTSEDTEVALATRITGTKIASSRPGGGGSGIFYEGSFVYFTISLTNQGAITQPDDPASDEFVDMLPPGLSLHFASVQSGGGIVFTDFGTNTVTWNGSIPSMATVVIEIIAIVDVGTAGTTLFNQGTINYDADGDGSNDTQGVTDDPAVGGIDDPTQVVVGIGVPTLSTIGLMLMAMLLGLSGLWLMRRQRS